MPDTPRTVKLLVEKWRSAGWKAAPKEAELFNGLGIATCGVLLQIGILDALIGAQGRVVYTAEDVARAGEAVCESGLCGHFGSDCAAGHDSNTCPEAAAAARAAITAAGGVVADEVVEVGEMTCVKAENVFDDVLAQPGDTLYIVRAGAPAQSVTVDCHSKEE